MRSQGFYVVFGVFIFMLSAALAFLLPVWFSLDVEVVFAALVIEAALVFLSTALFLNAVYKQTMQYVKKAVKGDTNYDAELTKDRVFMEVIKEITEANDKMRREMAAPAIQVEKLGKMLSEMRQQSENDRLKFERIKEDIKNIRIYLSGNDKTFEKIRAIGLEIKTTSKNIDGATQNVLHDAKQQSEVATRGVKAIGREITGVNDLKQSILSSTQIIEELMGMSDQIKGFVTKIADMAKKTNLLALNAGIEAARAGEAGKSFSVVASEIKKLSANSNLSAEEITAILKGIQEKTKEVIEIIKMTEKIEENINTFYKTGDLFIEIVKAVKHIEKILMTVSGYTNEHFTDSELLFKIINDNASKASEYMKLVERIDSHADELVRSSATMWASFEKINDSMGELLDSIRVNSGRSGN